jgi:hypothetical protein
MIVEVPNIKKQIQTQGKKQVDSLSGTIVRQVPWFTTCVRYAIFKGWYMLSSFGVITVTKYIEVHRKTLNGFPKVYGFDVLDELTQIVVYEVPGKR